MTKPGKPNSKRIRMSRRAFMHMAGLGAASAVLAACAPAASTEPAATAVPATATAAPPTATGVPPTAVPTATTVPTAAPTATEAMKQLQGQIVISNWHQGTGVPSPEAQQALTDAYHQFQPEVDIIFETQVGGDYSTWLGTELAAGKPRPDLVSGNYQPSYDKYVDLISYRDAINPYTGNKWSDDFDFEFFASGATKIVFVATQQSQVVWFYNQDLFDQAGVTQTPATYDEWMDVCDKLLTATGIAPITSHFYNLMQWGAEVYFDQYHREWLDVVRAQPGDWNYNPAKDDAFVFSLDDKDINRKCTFSIQRLLKNLKEGTLRYDDAEMEALITNWARMAPYVNVDFWAGIPRYPRFIQGQCAMIPQTFPTYWTLQQDLAQLTEARRTALGLDATAEVRAFNYGFFQYPSMTGPLVKAPARGIESYQGEYLNAIEKTAAQTEVDVDFMMFWLSKAGYQSWVDGFAASDLWTPSGKLLISGVDVPEKYATVLDAIKPIGNAEAAPNGFLLWTFGGLGTQWVKEAELLLKSVFEGETTPAEFGPRYHTLITETYWDDILKELKLTEDEVMNPQLEPAG